MKSYAKHSRIQFMVPGPLGDNGEFLTGSQRHIDFSRKAATEGMVLLKNECSALPFAKGQKLAVFGKASFDTVKGGGGSGNTNTAYTRKLYEGLQIKESEGKLALFAPLGDYYRAYVSEEYAKNVAATGIEGAGTIAEAAFPEELAAEARQFTDTAVITISRFSGESYDRTGTPGDGDFYLSNAEAHMVERVKALFPKCIVLLNTGGIMDLTWIKDDPVVTGCLLVWQGGIETGLAAADLLTGDVTPSGHLSDTFADRFSSYPNAEKFNDSDDYVEYGEDIFVGYRYFETFEKEKAHVVYPFGYGLSYTTFSMQPGALITDGDGFSLGVTVTNTGDRPGKEVVQLYASCPQGLLGKPARTLVAFKKTRLLAPGESSTVTLSFTEYQLSSYDDLGKVEPSAYVLERGVYTFTLGENVRDAEKIADEFVVENDKVVEKLSKKCAPKRLRARLTATGEYEALPTDFETPVTPFEADLAYLQYDMPKERAISAYRRDPLNPVKEPIYFSDVTKGKATLDEFFAQLSLEDKVSLLHGHPNRGMANTYGFGNNLYYKIPSVMTADGPQGVRLHREIGLPTTAFPVATLLACTFNEDLLYELGETVAEEVAECNFGIWLAPAINIHRNPLCGRNFEYYSEDPYLAGKLAASLVRGVQSHGIAVSVKHFACNNKETNRKESDSRLSERALREIYVKAFEICVKESDPWTIMSSYNLINGKRASENRELLTDILRGEWGFNGVVTSDWRTDGIHCREVAAGNDIKMPYGSDERLIKDVHDGYLSMEDVDTSARRVLELFLKLA